MRITPVRFDSKREGWWVVAAEQLLYPEGGGQPADRGTIGGFEVVDVQKMSTPEEGVQILLRSKLEDRDLLSGSREVLLDWKHRFDMMQQHSGQHLLTALILKNLGYWTVRFHISAQTCSIDLDANKLEEEELIRIETMVNELILQDVPLTSFVMKRSAFEEGRVKEAIRSRGLPNDAIQNVRMIEIEGVDLNNCGGTHVRSTAQLQLCKILKTERVNKRARLHFVFGGRALSWMGQRQHQEESLTEVLCQGFDNHVPLVRQLVQVRKDQAFTLDTLESLWLKEVALRLGGYGEAVHFFHPRLTMKGMQMLVRELRIHHPNGHFVVASEQQFLVESPLILNQKGLKEKILAVLQGKGGGRPPRIQGKAEHITADKVEATVKLIQSLGDYTHS